MRAGIIEKVKNHERLFTPLFANKFENLDGIETFEETWARPGLTPERGGKI